MKEEEEKRKEISAKFQVINTLYWLRVPLS
jgi:hypothetical protein